MADTVAALLERSLRHVATEAPAGHARLSELLQLVVVEIAADDTPFVIGGPLKTLVRIGTVAQVDVRVTTDRAAIAAVIDGRITLAVAVESGRVAVTGRLDDVVRAHDALVAYVHAAVRAPSVPALLAALRPPKGSGAA